MRSIFSWAIFLEALVNQRLLIFCFFCSHANQVSANIPYLCYMYRFLHCHSLLGSYKSGRKKLGVTWWWFWYVIRPLKTKHANQSRSDIQNKWRHPMRFPPIARRRVLWQTWDGSVSYSELSLYVPCEMRTIRRCVREAQGPKCELLRSGEGSVFGFVFYIEEKLRCQERSDWRQSISKYILRQ